MTSILFPAIYAQFYLVWKSSLTGLLVSILFTLVVLIHLEKYSNRNRFWALFTFVTIMAGFWGYFLTLKKPLKRLFGEIENVRGWWSHYLSQNLGEISTWYERALICYEQQKYQTSAKMIYVALQENPGNVKLKRLFGKNLLGMGYKREAFGIFKKIQSEILHNFDVTLTGGEKIVEKMEANCSSITKSKPK